MQLYVNCLILWFYLFIVFNYVHLSNRPEYFSSCNIRIISKLRDNTRTTKLQCTEKSHTLSVQCESFPGITSYGLWQWTWPWVSFNTWHEYYNLSILSMGTVSKTPIIISFVTGHFNKRADVNQARCQEITDSGQCLTGIENTYREMYHATLPFSSLSPLPASPPWEAFNSELTTTQNQKYWLTSSFHI